MTATVREGVGVEEEEKDGERRPAIEGFSCAELWGVNCDTLCGRGRMGGFDDGEAEGKEAMKGE